MSIFVVKTGNYGIVIRPRRPKQKPVPVDLSGDEGARLWREAVARVMTRHAKVIKALAGR